MLTLGSTMTFIVVVLLAVGWWGPRSAGPSGLRALDRDLRSRGWPPFVAGPVAFALYHSRILKTPREVHRTLRYVLLNARRHAAQQRASTLRATAVLLDPASSARWFDGWRPGKEVAERASSPLLEKPAVARARAWLLRKGWRLHGLIDPADVPG